MSRPRCLSTRIGHKLLAYLLQDVVGVVDGLGEMRIGLANERRVLEKAFADAHLSERFVQNVRLEVVEHQTGQVHDLLQIAKDGLLLRRLDL